MRTDDLLEVAIDFKFVELAKVSSDLDLVAFGKVVNPFIPGGVGDPFAFLGAEGELGKEFELEKLSSSLDSDLCTVDTDLADPELMDPEPGRRRECCKMDRY